MLLFTIRAVTHKLTLQLAGDTAAQCLLLKDCSHDSAECGPPAKDFSAHAKTLTSVLESPLWECGASLLPSATPVISIPAHEKHASCFCF